MDLFAGINTLLVLEKQGSYENAEKVLGKSANNIKRTIQILEKEVGAQLLFFYDKKIHLTEAGKVYAKAAKVALASLHNAENLITKIQEGIAGELKIGASSSYTNSFLGTACAQFCQRYPKIKLTTYFDDDVDRLFSKNFDVILMDMLKTPKGMVASPIYHNKIIFCASPAYVEANKEICKDECKKNDKENIELCVTNCMQDFDKHQWLLYEHEDNNIGGLIVKRLVTDERKKLLFSKARIVSGNRDFLLSLSIAGTGVIGVTTWSAAPLITKGMLVHVLKEWEVDPVFSGTQIYSFCPEKQTNTQKVKLFINCVKEILRDNERILYPTSQCQDDV